MIDLDWTFFAQLVNFLVILTVLNLILFRPIRGIIKKRAEVMNEKLGSIESFTADAEAAEKVAAARKEIEGQKQAALKALRGEIDGYAKSVAGKVLSKA
jgi:F-type H+-transporting ATPase subunit b